MKLYHKKFNYRKFSISWRQERLIWYNENSFHFESPEERERREQEEAAWRKAEVLCAIQCKIDSGLIDINAIPTGINTIRAKIQELSSLENEIPILLKTWDILELLSGSTIGKLQSAKHEEIIDIVSSIEQCVLDPESSARKMSEGFLDTLVVSCSWDDRFNMYLTLFLEKILPAIKRNLGNLAPYSYLLDNHWKLFEMCLQRYGEDCFPETKKFLQGHIKGDTSCSKISEILIQCINRDPVAFSEEVVQFLLKNLETQYEYEKKDVLSIIEAYFLVKNSSLHVQVRKVFKEKIQSYRPKTKKFFSEILEVIFKYGGEEIHEEVEKLLLNEEYEKYMSYEREKDEQFPIMRLYLKSGRSDCDVIIKKKIEEHFIAEKFTVDKSFLEIVKICLKLGSRRFDKDIKVLLQRSDQDAASDGLEAKKEEEFFALVARCEFVTTVLDNGKGQFDNEIRNILCNSNNRQLSFKFRQLFFKFHTESSYLITICLQFGGGRFDNDIRTFLYEAQGEERLPILKQCIQFSENRFNDDVKRFLNTAENAEEKQFLLRESLDAEHRKIVEQEMKIHYGVHASHEEYEKNSIFTRYFLDAEFFTQYPNFFFTQESFLEIWKSFTTDSERYIFYERVKQLVVRSIGENGELGVVSDIEAKSFYTTTETNYDDENGKWISDPTKRKEVVKNHERNPIAQGLRQQIQEFDNFFEIEFSKSTEFWNAKMKAEFHCDEEGKDSLDKLKKYLRESDEIQLEIIDENSDDRQKVIEIIKDSFHISDASAPSELDIVQRAGKVGGNGFDYVLKTKDGVVLGGFLDVAPTQTKGVWYGKMMAIDSKVSSLGLGGILLKKIAQHLESSGVKSLDANVPIYKINSLLNIGKLGGVVTKMVSRSPKQVEKSSLKSEDRVDRFYIRWDLKKILQGRTGADFSSSPNISLVEIGDQNSSTDMSPKEIRVYSKDKPVEGKMLELKQSIEQSLSTSINGKNFFVVTVPFFDDITMNGVSGKEKNKRGNAQLSCAMGLDYLFDCGFEIHGAKIEGNQLLYYFRKKSSSFIDFVPTVLKKLSSWFSLS